jgi:hypothetical protein
MPRIRSIKPEFPQSESMGRVSREARLLFVLLWTVCDDDGRARAASRMLASLLYPYDDDAPKQIDGWLTELERENCIERYQVEGSTYLQVCKWLSHQRIDHPTASKFPSPREGSRILASDSEVLAPDRIGEDRIGRDRIGPKVPTEPLSGDAPDREVVDRVFEHWRTVHGHPQAKLDAKRRKLIRDALKGYSEADLCQSISGYKNSPHHQGQNDKATVYDAIELLLRDAKHIDAGLRFYRDPPRTDLSSLTRRNVAAVENWIPPELRAAQ